MNMSMDKPIALNNTEGIRGPQMKKCINGVKFRSPELSLELSLGFLKHAKDDQSTPGAI